ncbi:polycystic kidney disease protein 1-like 1 isoform X2 [Xenopus tropicalis]|uniref:Polycystin-1-like protein 1 n=1 Tax=Xenopus tropicalis TaxID=8364 RepID=A0A8J1JPQ5_XENTR|nr:polycystic kidney disease protein 1-like 1 isoform X2 [Xenopus tropicalis]
MGTLQVLFCIYLSTPAVFSNILQNTVSIVTNGTFFSTETNIIFKAVTSESGPVHFVWNFGDKSLPESTYNSVISKKYSIPNSYNVIVNASSPVGTVVSEVYTIFIQKKVIPNRLIARPSVLINSTVTFECRINSGTNISYLWNFGDETIRFGKITDTHVYMREGEYTVNVSIFNNVSAAFLTKQIFVVRELCLPPPVKHMGPQKIQIRRYEQLCLGVTFEAEIMCNISQGLHYFWSFVKSNGNSVILPNYINDRKQKITVPGFLLEYENYTAVARVQIVGNVVYSNYTVLLEVLPSDPVSVIAGGTHFLIDKSTVTHFKLDGSASFDPDYPEASLRFHWKCIPVSLYSDSCFNTAALNPLQTDGSIIHFPTALLNEKFDQFLISLTVSNGNRRSPVAQAVLSISSRPNFRDVQIICIECKGYTVNWNEKFSVQVVCTECREAEISYSWELYSINTTEVESSDGPFCSVLEILGSSSLFGTPLPSVEIFTDPPITQIISGDIFDEHRLTEEAYLRLDPCPKTVPSAPIHGLLEEISSGGRPSRSKRSEYTTALRNISHEQSGEQTNFNGTYSGFLIGGGEGGADLFNLTEVPTHSDLEVHCIGIQEGKKGSGGRPEDPEGERYGSTRPHENEDQKGDEILNPSKAAAVSPVTSMLDWKTQQISKSTFRGFVTTDLSSQVLTFKPFSLKPGKMYMLDVSLASRGNEIGKSQLYFTVNEMAPRMTCQVQPNEGMELYTVFSIFCTSGKEDLYYDFSYQVGRRSARKKLYEGRDIQYYFNLPAGDQTDGYQVTLFTQITNMYGSQTKPCPVNVTVWPSFGKNTSTDFIAEQLYHHGLKNLSVLLLMENHIEIRNYITLLTVVLNKLYSEETKTPFELQSKIRNALISALCSMSFQDEDEFDEIVSMLIDLLNYTKQVTAKSAILVVNATKKILKRSVDSEDHSRIYLQRNSVEKIVSLISYSMEVSIGYNERNFIVLDGMNIISDLMLEYIAFNKKQHLGLSTNLIDFQTSTHMMLQNSIQTIGSTKVYLPQLQSSHLETKLSNRCYISQLVYFKKNPYLWAEISSQLQGEFAGVSLFNCSNKKKINAREIAAPVMMEFDMKRNHDLELNKNLFSLYWDKVNFHRFHTVSVNRDEALLITVTFSRPNLRAFPVLLLVRYSDKPNTSHFNIKEIYTWEGNSVQIFIPAHSIKDGDNPYLAIMDADYNRQPRNKYLSKMINYTLETQWTKCLYWDYYKQWNSESCFPQKGTLSTNIICSCKHLGIYTYLRSPVNTSINTEEISQYLLTTKNVIPCTFVLLTVFVYTLLAIYYKFKDRHEEKKNGVVFLQDNSPNDHQHFAIVVDVGLRSRPKSTAKVYVVLHGEDGVSETRELYFPDKPLFEKNSRQAFVMSVSESLGPIWKIHIWHNNSGYSPSLYLSHIIVKDLQSGHSYFFLAECWLAMDEGDGKVERELTSAVHGLEFKKLFYCKLTELLEDLHLWGSLFSRPSYSCFTYTQRITVCLVLLLGYMFLNSVLIHWEEEQHSFEHGLLDVSPVSMISGFQSTLALYPLAALISLLFRFSEKKLTSDSGEEKLKVPIQTNSSGDHRNSLSPSDTMFESNLTWQHFQYWAYDAWKKKYERDYFTPSIHSVNCSKRSKKGSPSPTIQSSSGFEDCSQHLAQKNCSHSSCDTCSEFPTGHRSLFGNQYKVLPQWCIYLAWCFCAVISIVCAAGTTLIGFSFGPTKCILWAHSVFFSVIFCTFVVQPSTIFIIAFFMTWRKKEIIDLFAETVCEATKYFQRETSTFEQISTLHSCPNDLDISTDFEKILAARKRARYLRLARPPSPSQLKVVKDKIRKKTTTEKTFRECFMHGIMILIFLFITLGKCSNDDYLLNQAVRNEFTRHAKQSFKNIRTEDDWWNWSFNVLLDGLYWNKMYNITSAKSKTGPIGGKFFLIGTPIIQKFSLENSSACVTYSFISSIISSYNQANDKPKEPDTENHLEVRDKMHHRNGKVHCYKGRKSVINLGRSRTEAYSALLRIQSQQWINHSTTALHVLFTLYNPPTNVFTVVLLQMEFPASGGVITSSLIESFKIYHIATLLDYITMALKLLFLGLILLHSCFQLGVMIQTGIRNYWQEPWNWIELGIIASSLCYYACITYTFLLTMDMIDRLQKVFFRIFIDCSILAAWEKWNRSLHGIIFFLMVIKFIKLFRIYKVMAPCLTVLHLSSSSMAFTMISGIIFSLAFSSLGHVIVLFNSFHFSNMIRSLHMLFMNLLGVGDRRLFSFLHLRTKSVPLPATCVYVVLFLFITILWTGMIRGILTSIMKNTSKIHRNKQLITLTDVASHAKEKVYSVFGRQRMKSTDTTTFPRNNFYLEEFEDLIDELLFRLNAISNSLHHSLPAKLHCYTEEAEEVSQLESHSVCCFKPPQESDLKNDLKIQRQNTAKSQYYTECATVNTDLHRSNTFKNHSAQSLTYENSSSDKDETVSCMKLKSNTELEGDQTSMHKTKPKKQPVTDTERCRSQVSEELKISSPTTQMKESNFEDLSTPFCSDQFIENIAMDPEKTDGKNRCTSATDFCKNRKPLKRSHTTVIELLDNSCKLVWNKVHEGNPEVVRSTIDVRHSEKLHCFSMENTNAIHPQVTYYEGEKGSHMKQKSADTYKYSKSKLPEGEQNERQQDNELHQAETNRFHQENCDLKDTQSFIKQCWY